MQELIIQSKCSGY